MTDNTVIIYRNVKRDLPMSAAPYNLPEPTIEAFKAKFGDREWLNDYEYYFAMTMEEARKLGYTPGNEFFLHAWAEKIMEQRHEPTAAAVRKKRRKEYVPDLPVAPDDAMAAVREFCK